MIREGKRSIVWLTDDLFEMTIAGDNLTNFVKPNELVAISTQIYRNKNFLIQTCEKTEYYHIHSIISYFATSHTSIFDDIQRKFLRPTGNAFILFWTIDTNLSLMEICSIQKVFEGRKVLLFCLLHFPRVLDRVDRVCRSHQSPFESIQPIENIIKNPSKKIHLLEILVSIQYD